MRLVSCLHPEGVPGGMNMAACQAASAGLARFQYCELWSSLILLDRHLPYCELSSSLIL